MKHDIFNPIINESQKRHADRMGLSYEEYQEHVTNRIEEVKNLPKTDRNDNIKKDKVVAKKPVLIIGAGPSMEANLEKAKNFNGIKLCLDVNFNRVFEYGIVPDYLMTMEKYVRSSLLNREYLEQLKDKTVLVGSSITHNSTLLQASAVGMKQERWMDKEEVRCANVGTFSMSFAYKVLRADKIFLIGFEHDGVSEDANTYAYWQADFWYFAKQWPIGTLINCSGGGKLYYENRIWDSTLDSMVLENGNIS